MDFKLCEKKLIIKKAAPNIRRAKSAVNADVINQYFDELEATFERLGMLHSLCVIFFCNKFEDLKEFYIG